MPWKETPEHHIWRGMIARCHNHKDAGRKNYGGRGIRVHLRWRLSFEAFLADMGERPSPQHSIDRKDNDGHYEPSNCRWALPDVQNRNRRTNRFISMDGQRVIHADAARAVGVTRAAMRLRIATWGPERAVAVRGRHKPRGAEHKRSKLTDTQALAIYNRSRAGERGVDLAREFNVTASIVTRIRDGRMWSHVTGAKRST